MDELVCYCFGYSEADIRADVAANNGHSLILDRIVTEKQAGTCRCSETHPQGR